MRPHLRRTPAQPGIRRANTPLAVLAAAGLLLVGCQGDDPTDDQGAEEEAESPRTGYGAPRETEDTDAEEVEEADGEEADSEAGTHLTITDHEFDVPEPVAPGAEITVTNHDSDAHTVTSDEVGLFDVDVGPGETVSFVAPEEPGDYGLHCVPHPYMTGTLVVE
ncbi:cupredoxin domain-containing protein [Nesterenkonia suensis]